MAYTTHGHHILGSPLAVARCGGPSLCRRCAVDYLKWHKTYIKGMENNMDLEGSPILQYFEFGHLADALREVSRPFYNIAYDMEYVLPRGPEKSVCLRKLLEAKDAAVRAALDGTVRVTPREETQKFSYPEETQKFS